MRQQHSGVQVEPKSTLSDHGMGQIPSLAATGYLQYLLAPYSRSSAKFKHCALLWARSMRGMHMHRGQPREGQSTERPGECKRTRKSWKRWLLVQETKHERRNITRLRRHSVKMKREWIALDIYEGQNVVQNRLELQKRRYKDISRKAFYRQGQWTNRGTDVRKI